jgi:excisionase family DNA binding protein
MPKYISTSEAARIAGVTPSSIKRWADQNRLPCEKTAGGHRRFELGALRRFMDVADWTNVLSKGAHNATLARLYQSLHERKQWCHVADGLGPVLKSIGDQWASGTLTIAEEHVASDTLTRALTHIGSGLGIGNGSRRALLATVEGDQHELGLCLKARMWDSMWLGRDTPTTVLVDKIMNERLDIVALSASVNAGPSRELISHVSRVAEACRSQGVLLVLGGDGTWPEIEGAVRARSFAEFDTLLTRLF